MSATVAATPSSIIGRGLTDGARLFRQWFERLDAAAERNEPAAYVFVMGSLTELLRCFDFQLVFPEINSLQTAVRRVAHEYLNDAEDYGYSPDVCGYVKADVAVQLRDGKHPMGRIPKPSIAVLTNACNTYIKWAEIWERLHGTPVFTLDVPGTRAAGDDDGPGTAGFARDVAYVTYQIKELIALCEQVTGIRFDLDRLRAALAESNEMNRSFRTLLELNQRIPAPFNAVTDGTVYLGVLNGFRGTPEGRAYFAEVLEEMWLKVERHIGTVQQEEFRLVFVGVPCYPMFRRFSEMFSERGGAFVSSTYLAFASGGTGGAWTYDLARPLESLAEGLVVSVRLAMDSMFFSDRALAELARPFRADGVVYHAIKSCRTVSTGLADARRAFSASCDVPSLFLESDMMDRRVISEAQLKNRIDAFFEGLAVRRPDRQTQQAAEKCGLNEERKT